MKRLLACLLFFLPALAWAQYTVTGKVINLYDKKPIEKASVFLSNTTVGSATSDDGSYTLANVKSGQYELIVSAVGYETFTKTIVVNQQLNIPYIELTPKTISLNAVVVKPDPDWQQNYNIFKQELLGSTDYAEQCKILNPDVLNIDFDKKSNTLTATSNDYLEIENKALGYKLKYRLTDFIRNFASGSLYYQGDTFFIPLEGSKSQQKRWNKNRLNAYLGSSQHYLRSALGNQLSEDGFKTMQLIRKPNPQRPPDSLVKAKLRQFGRMIMSGKQFVIQNNDSLRYWQEKNKLPKMVEYLVTKPLRADSLIKRTDLKGIYALGYKDILYVIYTKKRGNTGYVTTSLKAPDYPTSLMNFTEPYAFFDANGIIANPTSVVFEGNWSTDRIAKLLPYDYDPNSANNP
ncbi:carboxypeptidase-like regulatory domain-containing protein [Mucilaginibacter sp. CSA2-8R]|uniref:carboxypeptidase-like regulatory domain-containing protein n=1 Tax=Mucilaginibacter sp. CSA2-8R TaxID=3141542 RepID=UPI00315D9B47